MQKYFPGDFFYGKNRTNNQEVKNLRVHSQAALTKATREKEYPFYYTRPDFIYYFLRHAGEMRSLTYGVADPESRTLGIYAGDFGTFCHREGNVF